LQAPSAPTPLLIPYWLHRRSTAGSNHLAVGYSETAISTVDLAVVEFRPCLDTPSDRMRSRERILANLEALYRESYDRAKQSGDQVRMTDLDSAYMRDQLMLEILLDIRDLFSVAPAASGGTALDKLEAIRRLTQSP
jgi:hypothetical protein